MSNSEKLKIPGSLHRPSSRMDSPILPMPFQFNGDSKIEDDSLNTFRYKGDSSSTMGSTPSSGFGGGDQEYVHHGIEM